MSNLKVLLHRLTFTRVVTLDGVRVCTDPRLVPKTVRRSIIKGGHEQYERQLVGKYLSGGDRVLEIGAATGLVSLVCARQCGPDNVLAYEANPVMEPVIRKNFDLNGWNPQLVMRAITLDGGEIRFFASDNVYSSSLIDRSDVVGGRMISVPSDPFQRVIEEFQPTTIVMDVEGAETELLCGVDFGKVNKIIVEVHPHITGEEPVAALEEHLQARGFRLQETAHKTRMFMRDNCSS